MQNLKFRAWDGKTMHYTPDFNLHFSNKGIIAALNNGAMVFNTDGQLQQFTGITDKNKKDIYEGDIVKFHQFTEELGENLGVREGENEFIAVIGFGSAGITINDEPYFIYGGTHEDSLEIIGNRFENPELLK